MKAASYYYRVGRFTFCEDEYRHFLQNMIEMAGHRLFVASDCDWANRLLARHNNVSVAPLLFLICSCNILIFYFF